MRGGRGGALCDLAADLPAPVLADLLGMHINTAVRWGEVTNHNWTVYIAERAADFGTTPAADQTEDCRTPPA